MSPLKLAQQVFKNYEHVFTVELVTVHATESRMILANAIHYNYSASIELVDNQPFNDMRHMLVALRAECIESLLLGRAGAPKRVT